MIGNIGLLTHTFLPDALAAFRELFPSRYSCGRRGSSATRNPVVVAVTLWHRLFKASTFSQTRGARAHGLSQRHLPGLSTLHLPATSAGFIASCRTSMNLDIVGAIWDCFSTSSRPRAGSETVLSSMTSAGSPWATSCNCRINNPFRSEYFPGS